MQDRDKYYKELFFLIESSNIDVLTKKIIDLTLDTEDIVFYRKTMHLISKLDSADVDVKSFMGQAQILLENLIEYLSQKPIPEQKELIKVDHLSKTYKSYFTLGPISFSAKTGDVIGLVGENGNGKTTLLRLLCGELIPSAGSINFNLGYTTSYDLRTQLVYIPQRTKDWNGTLLTNLQFTAASYGIKGEENELLVDLIISRMGLRAFRSYNWKSISSGYKMRFELARMLLRKPKLLLIDEPLANLDIVAQQVVLDDFRDIAKSPYRPLAIVLSSQQLYEVEKNSDQVIFLRKGKPENISDKQQKIQEKVKTIIEFDSSWDQSSLSEVFLPLGLENIQMKGGSYIITFSDDIDPRIFLQKVLELDISISYFRNISNSSRRFFI